MPLSALHARNLNDPADVKALICDLQQECGVHANGVDVTQFVTDLVNVGRELPSKRALLTPYIERQPFGLRFRLENTGNQDLELVMIEVSVPKRYVDPNWHPMADPNLLEVIQGPIDGAPYLTLRCKVFDGPISFAFGSPERLPRLLAAGMPPHELKPPFSFALLSGLKESDGGNVPIFYSTFVRGMRPQKGETNYRELLMDSYSPQR
jgi:hypothetical protein